MVTVTLLTDDLLGASDVVDGGIEFVDWLQVVFVFALKCACDFGIGNLSLCGGNVLFRVGGENRCIVCQYDGIVDEDECVVRVDGGGGHGWFLLAVV